jgi:UDP-N-acetylglucosamine/UDP-N-acetylgalactosamine diphosphorylase
MSAALQETVNNLLGVHKHAEAGPHEPSSADFQQIKQSYEKAGQDQIFTFWDTLDSAQKGALFNQIKNVDPSHINDLVKKVLQPSKAEAESAPSIEPIPASVASSILDSKPDDLKSWYNLGLEHVAHNRVGVVLMAGGQGTRLGSSAPKGCFDIGLPSKKSLFQLQAERILKVQLLAAKAHGKADPVVPWYVMTSGPTRGPTEKFFADNGYFGLKKENVFVFEQGVLPCISNEGKIIMESKSKVSLNSIFATKPVCSLLTLGCCCP